MPMVRVSNGGTLHGYAISGARSYVFILDLESGKSVRANSGSFTFNGIVFTIPSLDYITINKNGKVYASATLPMNTINDYNEFSYVANNNLSLENVVNFYVPS